MDLTTAETRARIACRIYLKLFDAGDQGALIVYDDMFDRPLDAPRAHVTVQHILKRLCEDDAIHQNDNGRPHQYILLDSARTRMAHRFGANPLPYYRHIEHDLVAFAAHEAVPAGNWLDYEVRIRKGQLDRDLL